MTTFIDQLLQIDTPYAPSTDDSTTLFNHAMHEADEWHRAHNPNYAKLWENNARPMIPVGLFKQTELATQLDEDGLLLSSSGTSGNATQVFFDHISLQRMEQAMFKIFMFNGMFSQQPAKFLLLSPDPRTGNFPGYATSFLKFTACAPIEELVFAVNGQGVFDCQLALSTLERWADSPSPIFIFGLTVFFEQLSLGLTQPIHFSGDIKGITGGGWKGLTKTMERTEIIAKLQQNLCAQSVDIRDIFGMTEHPIQYLSCPFGHFHEPAYSTISVVGANGVAVKEGDTGLIRLQSPLYRSLPTHDILTEDSGMMGSNCPCGNPKKYLQYLGRTTSLEGICASDAVKKNG